MPRSWVTPFSMAAKPAAVFSGSAMSGLYTAVTDQLSQGTVPVCFTFHSSSAGRS